MMTGKPCDLAAEAAHAIDSRWVLIRLKGKRPVDRGWSRMPGLSLENALAWIERGRGFNLGVNTGRSGLLVVDVDDPEWADPILSKVITPTARTGGGGRHLFFKMPGSRLGNTVGCLAAGVDTRGEGGQVVLAGSTHPATNKPYAWVKGRSPWEIPLAKLPDEWFRRLSPESAHSKHHDIPPSLAGTTALDARSALVREVQRVRGSVKGCRNNALNRASFTLGGFIARNELTREEVGRELYRAAEDCGLTADPADGPSQTWRTINSGVDAAFRGETPQTGSLDRPTIRISGDLAETVAAAEKALVSENPPGVFQRAGQLVDVVTRAPGRSPRVGERTASIHSHTDASLQLRLAHIALWQRYDRRSCGFRAAAPPRETVRALREKGQWVVPELTGVTEHPLVLPGGDILTTSGYDRASGIFFLKRSTYPEVPREPSPEDIRIACQDLIDPLCDFPFATDSDRAVIIATLLALLARPAIEGPVPLTAVRKNAPGSGGTLLADLLSVITTGRGVPRLPAIRDEAELQKTLMAIARGGYGLVLIDNVEGPLGSPTLAAVLTGGAISGRVLGTPDMAEVPLSAVFITNGNGLRFQGDLGRRALLCDLRTDLEFPEDRADFKYPRLLDHVREHRTRLVVAGLTLLKGFVMDGSPSHGEAPKGSFESWDALIRGALIWAGLPDPISTTARIRTEGDSELEALRHAHAIWTNRFPQPVPAKEASAICESDTEFRDAMFSLYGSRAPSRVDSRTLGNRLRVFKDRVVDGHCFVNAGTDRHSKATLWTVVDIRSRSVRSDAESLPYLKREVSERTESKEASDTASSCRLRADLSDDAEPATP